MLTVGIARVGNEPAVRYTSSNKAVLELSLAFSYGRKGQDGKYPTQWVNASLWGERAEKLAQYIQKGNQIYVQLTDLHMDTYTKKDGSTASNIKAMVQDLQLIGGREAAPAPHQQFAPPTEKYPAGDPFAGLDDGDIPF